MIDIFYYIGIIYILMQTRVFFKTDKSMKEMNDTLDYLDKAKVSARNGEGVNRKEVLDRYNKKFNIKAFIGICTLIWNVVGIFITEQRMFFIVLLIITLVSPYVIRMTTKDEKQQVILSYMTNIASLILVSAINYNHFFKNILQYNYNM